MSRILFLVTAAALSVHAATTDEAAPELEIRIRNDAGVPRSMLKAAISTLAKVYRKAGVRLMWQECSARQGCADTLGSDVRILVLGAAGAVGQRSPGPGELGRAVLHEGCRQGRIAYIFASLVDLRATQAAMKLRQRQLYSRLLYHRLLGYAMAHELAHLLGVGHGAEGLMAVAWDTDTLDEIRRGTLTFEPRQADHVLASVTKQQGCPADYDSAGASGRKTRRLERSR